MTDYNKMFTKKTAIAEIQRLEKNCAKLAGQLSNANIILKCDSNIKEIARLKSEIVQFRKTQDYQSDKIMELLEEVKIVKMDADCKQQVIDIGNRNIHSRNDKIQELTCIVKKRDKTINMLQVDMGFMSRAFMEQGVMFHTGRELTSGYDEKCDGGYKSTVTDLKAGV